uniref:SET domain-containing protein n=1 Tax=Sander lucioperca TaxID=283035 RepID=A0A8C9Y1Q3_SANLU
MLQRRPVARPRNSSTRQSLSSTGKCSLLNSFKNGTPLTHATTVIDRFCRRHGPLEDEGSTSFVVSAKRKASMIWDNFLDGFPVTLHGIPPTQEESKAKGYEGGRVFYHKWRGMQRKLRMDYILMDYPHRKPSQARVRYQLQREGWTSNAPKVDEILACWKSEGGSGLAITDLGPPKGKGVVATMPFQAGDVVCDYHGELVTEAEGRQRQSHVPDGTDMYFFYFKSHNGARMLRLALPFSGGLRDIMIFVATRNVTVKEELTWDYGVRQSSFGGEGRNLEWLNE